MNIMIFTDNMFMYKNIKKIIDFKNLNKMHSFFYACSASNQLFNECSNVEKLKIKNSINSLVEKYELILSCHSKQIFPKKLVDRVRCINIHPGLNPYNRGWYPQVFSIIGSMPIGATIHEMDEKIDHGNIISQSRVDIQVNDTSLEVYNRVLNAEVALLKRDIENIIEGDYVSRKMNEGGSYNSREDFVKLCELDMDEKLSFSQAIDKLRALTHGEFSNAFFYDKNGCKVYVRIHLEKEIG